MPSFSYTGQRSDGQVERGMTHGANLDEVVKRLTDKGLQLTEVNQMVESSDLLGGLPPTEQRPAFQTEVIGRLVDTVPLEQMHFFFRQMAVLLGAGINPADALTTLSNQARSSKLKSILTEAKDNTIAGRPMSVAFQRYPEVFTPLMMAMVRAGEEGGRMPEQCSQVSEYLQNEIELRNMIKRETAMPKLTVVTSFLIIFGTNTLLATIAPNAQRLPVFLPLWILTLALGVGVWLFVKLGLPQPRVRRTFDEIALKVPGVGPMLHGFSMAKFGRAFGSLYKSGVPVPKALILAADACGNEHIRASVLPAVRELEQGRSVADTMAMTGVFSPIAMDMARTGETTGNMDQMLMKMAEFYEDEGAVKAQMATKIIGVTCLLIVAAYVLMVLVTFYSGYFGGLTSGV